jgi:hypothetical protein
MQHAKGLARRVLEPTAGSDAHEQGAIA